MSISLCHCQCQCSGYCQWQWAGVSVRKSQLTLKGWPGHVACQVMSRVLFRFPLPLPFFSCFFCPRNLGQTMPSVTLLATHSRPLRPWVCFAPSLLSPSFLASTLALVPEHPQDQGHRSWIWLTALTMPNRSRSLSLSEWMQPRSCSWWWQLFL